MDIIMPTIHCTAIEKPAKKFVCRVKRAPVSNVLFKPARWEDWTVLAETKEGAFKVACWHFYLSDKKDIIIQ
jgi:hypothetical protein